MEIVDLPEARILLKQAVETQGPDFIYKKEALTECMNVPMTDVDATDPRRTTGCLIGTAMLLKFGASLYLWPSEYRRMGSVLHAFRDLLTVQAAQYFIVAQCHQDHSGVTWGEAYSKAEEWAEIQHSTNNTSILNNVG